MNTIWNSLYVQADHPLVTATQIADHEAFHAKVNRNGKAMIDQLAERIASMDKDAFDRVVDKYAKALETIYDTSDYDAFMRIVAEEMLADAYSGINAFGAHAEQFGDTVNQWMDEHFIGKKSEAEMEQLRGPPEGSLTNFSINDNKGEFLNDRRGSQNFAEETARVEERLDGRADRESSGKLQSVKSWRQLTKSGKTKVRNQVEAHIINSPNNDFIMSYLASLVMTDVNNLGIDDYNIALDEFVKDFYKAVSTKNAVIVENAYYFLGGNITHLINEVNQIADRDGSQNQNFSIDDAEYLRLAENPAQNYDRLNEMVRQAAEDAGYNRLFYHGSKNGGGFTVFKDWQYFTENRNYAARYAQRDADGSLYETYVKMEKPFDTRDAEARAIFDDARSELGLGEIQDTGLPDWTDGYDLSEYIDENGLDYDGIILDEGGDMVNGEPVSRGLSYVVRDSAQIKSSDVVTYDDNGQIIPLSERFNPANDDIRFSADDSQAQERNSEQGQAKAAADTRNGSTVRPEVKATYAKSNLRAKVQTIFSIQPGNRSVANDMLNDVADRYLRNGYITEDDRQNLFDRLVEMGTVTVSAEESYREAREYLRGGKIYVEPSVIADFGDEWADKNMRDFHVDFQNEK